MAGQSSPMAMSDTASYDAVIKALRMLKKIRKLEGTVLIHEGVLLSADTLLHEAQNEGFVREVNALISLYRNSGKSLSRVLLGFDGGNVLLFHAVPFTLALMFGDIQKASQVEKAGEDFLHQWADSLKIDASVIGRPVDLDPSWLEGSEGKQASGMLEVTAKADGQDTVPVIPLPPGKPVEEKASRVNKDEAEPVPVVLALVPDPEIDEEVVEVEAAPEVSDTVLTQEITETQSMDAAPEKRWKAYRDKVETLFSKVLGRAQATRLIERELVAMGLADDGYLTSAQFRPFGQKLIKKVKDRSLRKQLEMELLALVEQFID